MTDKIHEGKLYLACYQDVGWAADERGRPAKAGGHDLRQEKRKGVQLKINKETGTRISTVVTLLRKEEKIAVMPVKRTSIHKGLPLTSFAAFIARN